MLRLLAPLLILAATSCCYLRPWHTPEGITRWQDPTPPNLPLREKAELYQQRLEAHHQTPEGLVRYRRKLAERPESTAALLKSYGDLADGCFHTGIYLAGQALRYAAAREPAAGEQVRHALQALELSMAVTGKHGLLARHFSPAGTIRTSETSVWRPSPTHPEYIWRSDVSKDQYAGFIHGLGVTLALVDEPEVRARIGRLAAAAADHLMANNLQIIDFDGERTTHGDLRGRFWGVPKGVDALIALAIFKVAAEATGGEVYKEFYRRLVEDGYPEISYWAHFTVLGVGNRVNDNMAFLALYPLLLLESDYRILEVLRRGAERTWKHVRDDDNAFFSLVHAALVADPTPADAEEVLSPRDDAGERGVAALHEFPGDKVEWPVDLTRPGFDFPQTFLNTRQCLPRSQRPVPLYLRPRSSSFWASDPSRLAGNLGESGDEESAGGDYLLAYWLARYHGFIASSE